MEIFEEMNNSNLRAGGSVLTRVLISLVPSIVYVRKQARAASSLVVSLLLLWASESGRRLKC